ncbi:hypothetical protein SY88_09275 [Clostridiales bacterium PH28_bin88]|nr:hypothetical protein SY88_09275 [Clostridiales bacterium PH28_bin88]
MGNALAPTAVLLVLLQLLFPYLVPPDMVYNYRVDFDLIKNRPANIDVVLEQVKKEIINEGLTDYVIILGDSVAYSGPGGPEESLAYYMELVPKDRPVRVFNLAVPAMQTGDIYVMLLKLKEMGIPTPNLIINLIYAGFVPRTPYPSIVMWLEDELRQLDPEAYAKVKHQLDAARIPKPDAAATVALEKRVNDYLEKELLAGIAPVRYRDFLVDYAQRKTGTKKTDEKGDTRPWTEKPFLKELMQQWEYQNAFSDVPFPMDDTSYQVYFLDRIIELTKDQNTLFFLAAVNQKLMEGNVRKPGYQANLKLVDRYFAGKPVKFLNLEHEFPDHLFADQIHLIPEGYSRLAQILWENLEPLKTVPPVPGLKLPWSVVGCRSSVVRE